VDPLTHSLLGAAIARTRVARGMPMETVALVGGANLPDVDVASAVLGSDASLGFRRGWTHGPLALAVLPPLLAAGLLAWARWGPRRSADLASAHGGRLLALTYLGCLTHPLLDWLNTYGVRLLMPLDGRWFYGDALFIIDPWLWLVLGGAVFLGSERRKFPWAWATLAVLASLIVLRAGATVPPAARGVWVVGLLALVVLRRTQLRARPAAVATTALGLTLAYVCAMIGVTTVGSAHVERELASRGMRDVECLMVGPEPANPFAWDVVADLGDRYVHGTLRWLPRPTLALEPEPILKPSPSPVLDAARGAPHVQGALSWMRFPYAEIEETRTGWTVWLLDARYVRVRSRGFGAAVVEVPRQDRSDRPADRSGRFPDGS